MIAWATGTNEFLLRGGVQRSTGMQSQIRASSIIAIKGKDFIVRNFDHVPTLTKDMLLARDRHAFTLSNRKILADQMELLLQGVPKSSRLHPAA